MTSITELIQISASAAVISSACALVGTFLLLRKMAMLGDAISHTVLPGAAIAFFVTGGRGVLALVIGSLLAGLLTSLLVGLLESTNRLPEGAEIGIVFAPLFAIGILIVSRYARSVHIDLDCVLYGEIALAALDTLVLGETHVGPRALVIGLGVLIVDLVVSLAFFKELKLTSFDLELAKISGFSPRLVQAILLGAVSVTIVVAFEAVGAVLVVAMLVVPPAAAYFVTETVGTMALMSVVFSVLASVSGVVLSVLADVTPGGTIVLGAGLIFFGSWILSRRRGLLALLISRQKSSSSGPRRWRI